MTSTLLTPAEFAATRTKLAKLNKRSKAKGFTGLVDITGHSVVLRNDGRFPELPNSARITMVETTIVGEPPKYDGWEFLSKLDIVWVEGEAQWVVSTAPGVTEPVDRSALVVGYCDHCKTNRPNRRKMYLVRNTATGEQIQVGSTCIKDFLGWSTMPVFIESPSADTPP